MHNCDSLDLAENKRKDLDAFIDQLYETIEQADKTYSEDGMEEGMSVCVGANDISTNEHTML